MKKFSISVLIAFAICSCSEENTKNTDTGSVSIKASAISSTGKPSTTGKAAASTVTITDFKINLENIELEIDEQDDNFSIDPVIDDLELKGPFLLDLLEPNKFLSQFITTIEVPNAKYEEIEYKFSKSRVAGDLLGKTFVIKGTINNKPFVMWSDKDIEVELDFLDPSKDFTIDDNNVGLNIKMQLDALLAELNSLAKKGLLVDNDNDGTIEITTGNDDDNSSYGDKLKELLEKGSYLDDQD